MACLTQRIYSSGLLRPLYLLIIVAMLGACSGAPRTAAPESTYIPDASYYQLMAEIAVQRKAYVTAAEQYLNAAVQSSDPELARRATEFAAAFGYETFALSGAQRWLEIVPENQDAHRVAGRLYLRRSDTDRAYTHLSALLGDSPDDEAFLALSEDLAAEGNTLGVTAVFKRLARRYPDSSGLQLALARAAMRSGDYELALLAVSNADATQTNSLELPLLVAQAMMAQGHDVAAIDQIESLRGEPASIAVELEYVRLLSAGGRMVQANEQLLELGKSYGIQPDFVRIHALINLAAGDLDTAAQDFSALLSAGKNVYECFYYLGRIAVIRGEYRDGIDYFARVRSGAYLLPAQISRARAHLELEEWQVALDNLQVFAANYPRQALAVAPTRAQVLFDMGEMQPALAVYDELLGYQPDSVDVLLAYGAMLDLAGELDLSLDAMRRAAELAPMDANVLNTLGYTLANRTRRHAEAYRLIRLALELEPESPAIIDSMGWVLYRLGRHEEARSYLEQAHALMDDPEIVAHLGELLWATGEADSARALLDRSLLDYPDNEMLVEMRDRLP